MKRDILKPYGKKLLALALSSALLLSAAACSGDAGSPSGGTSSGSAAKGRYMEEELSLPQADSSPLSLSINGGIFRLLTFKGLFTSEDGGKTWTPSETGSETLDDILKNSNGISTAAWAPDGALVFSAQENKVYRYWYRDKDGKEKEFKLDLPKNEIFGTSPSVSLDDGASSKESEPESGADEPQTDQAGSKEFSSPDAGGETEPQGGASDGEDFTFPENHIQKFEFLTDGTLLGIDDNGTIYHIDPSDGSFLHTLKAGKENSYTDFTLTKDTLVARHYEGADLYSLADWQLQERDSVLDSFLGGGSDSSGATSATAQSVTVEGVSIGGGDSRLFADRSDDSVYVSTEGGIYRHILGGSSMEQVVNGSLNSLSDPSFHVQDILKTSEGNFKALCWSQSDGKTKLVGYTYDPEMSAVPEKELKAYAFSDSTELRQAIAIYQKAHPDVYVNLELGVSGSDAVTISDALRTLNTNIMAGKGPDVIFLDGMPVENYLEKGLLADISDLVKGAAESDGLFDNVVSAYRQDGKDYAVPTRFIMPFQDAKSELLPKMDSLSGIADVVEQLRKENPEQESITGADSADSLLYAFYNANAAAWAADGKSFDQEKLTDFLTQMKRIYDAGILPKEGNGEAQYDDAGFVSFSSNASGGGSPRCMDLISQGRLISFEELSSVKSLSSIVSVNDKMEGYQYAPQGGQSGKVFIPTGIVGISAKSTQTETARDFVKFLLSQEAQVIDQGQGMPVNAAAFDTLAQPNENEGGGMAIISGDGTYSVDLTFRTPTVEEFAVLKKMVQELDTPSLQDATIRETVLEATAAYLEGSKDLDTAVSDILKKVNLYLSE